MLLLLAASRPRFTGGWHYCTAALLYLAAKAFELGDEAIYAAGGWLSGHTWKHLAAAVAVGVLAHMAARRAPLGGPRRGLRATAGGS